MLDVVCVSGGNTAWASPCSHHCYDPDPREPLRVILLGTMRTLIQHSMIFVFCYAGTASAGAQYFSLIKGSPIEATKTVTVSRAGESYSVSSRVARSSNSSTYVAIPNNKTGETVMIIILDIPGSRSILLDVTHKSYSVTLYSVPAIGDRPSKKALQRDLEFLRKLKPAHTSQNGYEVETTSLGFRTQDGFLEIGRRTVYDHLPPSSSLKEKIWEDWSIPALSIVAEKTGFDSDNKPLQRVRLTDIRTEEPDPHLFEIPQDYSPVTPRSSGNLFGK